MNRKIKKSQYLIEKENNKELYDIISIYEKLKRSRKGSYWYNYIKYRSFDRYMVDCLCFDKCSAIMYVLRKRNKYRKSFVIK